MEIHLYALCWNDADMLPFFFRHYDTLISKYVIFDDSSCDGSLKLLHDNPRVVVEPFIRADPDSFALSELSLSNECWKRSRGCADWVIIVDIDEHVFHPDLPSLLRRYQAEGVSIIPALGYQMISEEFPPSDALLCESSTWGAPWKAYSKLTFFDPAAITEINYGIGRHGAYPTGRVRPPTHNELLLLHYKFLGFEQTLARHRRQRLGLRSKDLDNGWGSQYSWSEEVLRRAWDGCTRNMIDIRTAAAVANYPLLGLWDPFRDEELCKTAPERDAALAEVTALRNSLAAANANSSKTTAERDAALAEVTALRNFTSWAVTAPLRLLSSLARWR